MTLYPQFGNKTEILFLKDIESGQQAQFEHTAKNFAYRKPKLIN